ncbi:ChaN family lipoprotein, partial [Arthrospira platensis SPKY1]|nr:ChaN family lipoprotein [Arthrospira platensis SPKY1]
MKVALVWLGWVVAAHAMGQDVPTTVPASPTAPEAIGARLDALLPAPVLVIGEQHDAAEHQRLQAEVVTHLARNDRLLALVLEMADRGRDTEGLPASASPEAVQQRLAWNDAGWPWARYGPVVMAAVQAGVPVYG